MRVKRIAVMLMVVLWGTGLAMGQTEWVQHPDNPIVGPGEPGAWDEGGRSATTVLFDGLIYHMWFSGADESLDRTDIGHATSSDGVEWTMDPANPVLTRGDSGAWDDNLLYGAAVTYDGAQFHMWYGGGDGSVQRTGYATSPDGTAWTKYAGNPVIDVGPQGSWDDWIVRAGTVIRRGHRMWFMGTSAAGVHIGFAESTDGIEWTKRPEPVLEPGAYPGAWDSPAMGNPFVVFDGSDFHMWFVAGVDRTPPNGRVSIGYAFSSDGITWTKHRDNPVVSTADNYAFLAPVVYDGSTWRMWYSHERRFGRLDLPCDLGLLSRCGRPEPHSVYPGGGSGFGRRGRLLPDRRGPQQRRRPAGGVPTHVAPPRGGQQRAHDV